MAGTAYTNTPLMAFLAAFQRRLADLLARRAHVNVVLIIKDGKIQQVRFDESVLPEDLVNHPRPG